MTKDSSPLYILRGHRLCFLKHIVFLSQKIDFVLTNSSDPDGKSLFSIGPFQGFPLYKWLMGIDLK